MLLYEQDERSLCAVILFNKHTHTPATDTHTPPDNICTTCSFTDTNHTTDMYRQTRKYVHISQTENTQTHTHTYVQHPSQVLVEARVDHLGTGEFMWVCGGRQAQIFTLWDVPVQHVSLTM